ncbi:unnamed protein product [Ectocarpus sp. 13 AM-2016]
MQLLVRARARTRVLAGLRAGADDRLGLLTRTTAVLYDACEAQRERGVLPLTYSISQVLFS